jgi:predicted nucleotidyltransferase
MVPKKILGHAEEKAQCERDFHDHNLTELSDLERILYHTVEVVENSGIPYALIGGLATKSLGRPRITHDIDFFVKPDDAERVLSVLEKEGYTSQKRDPFWLFKAWKDNILVDVIFKSSGDIYFDEEVQGHVRRINIGGRFVNAISPEDFVVIKAAAHQEHNPHHWHDALAVLKRENIDWEYLLRRAKHAPRRVLALLIYAQSNDIAIPHEIIKRLYKLVFEQPSYSSESIVHPYRNQLEQMHANSATSENLTKFPIYTKGKIMEALTNDERIAEHDIKVVISDSTIWAKGEVFTDAQRDAVNDVIKNIAPDFECRNQVNVRVLKAPEGSEAIK